MKTIWGLIALLTMSVASAQAPPAGTTIYLSWTPNLEYTDNTPIPAGTPITYNVYSSVSCTGCPCGSPEPLSLVQGGITTTGRMVNNPAYPVIVYVVTEVVSGVESNQTSPYCWSYAAAVSSSSSSSSSSSGPKIPGAPLNVTVTTTFSSSSSSSAAAPAAQY